MSNNLPWSTVYLVSILCLHVNAFYVFGLGVIWVWSHLGVYFNPDRTNTAYMIVHCVDIGQKHWGYAHVWCCRCLYNVQHIMVHSSWELLGKLLSHLFLQCSCALDNQELEQVEVLESAIRWAVYLCRIISVLVPRTTSYSGLCVIRLWLIRSSV
jgi:hypothetical protein